MELRRERRHILQLQPLLLLQKEAVPPGDLILQNLLDLLQAEGSYHVHLVQEAGGSR